MQQLMKDPYSLEFLTLAGDVAERDLEAALVAQVERFLLELGAGFAFVGRQWRLDLAGDEFFIDLLMFHIPTNRYVVLELKTTKLTPADVGQLNFYVAAVDGEVRLEPADSRPVAVRHPQRAHRAVRPASMRRIARYGTQCGRATHSVRLALTPLSVAVIAATSTNEDKETIMNTSTNRSRIARWAGVAAAVVSIAGVTQLADTTRVSAVGGLHVVAGDGTSSDSNASKRDAAVCPPDERVVGGGAWADDHGDGQVRLTQLQPMQSGGRDSFVVAAQEPDTGYAEGWHLQAYAVCAPAASVPGHLIVASAPASTNGAFVATAAGCPAGKKVIGSGAALRTSDGVGLVGGQVGLQVSRAAGPLDITRAAAHEDADGFSSPWTLTSFAICVTGIPGQHADTVLEAGPVVDPRCQPAGLLPTIVHGPGGGAGLNDSGLTWLQVIYPYSDLTGVLVAMSGPSRDGVVAQGVCTP